MSLRKVGSPEKLEIINNSKKISGLSLDPNIFVKEVSESLGKEKSLSLDQLHEKAKAMGIVDYDENTMDHVIRLLQSIGVKITRK